MHDVKMTRTAFKRMARKYGYEVMERMSGTGMVAMKKGATVYCDYSIFNPDKVTFFEAHFPEGTKVLNFVWQLSIFFQTN